VAPKSIYLYAFQGSGKAMLHYSAAKVRPLDYISENTPIFNFFSWDLGSTDRLK